MGSGHFQEFEDEYLETLFDFHEKNPGMRVRNGDLASYLGVSPASATEMVQRLAKNGFVDYVPYKGVLLTDSGLEHGAMMKRRHRLAEVLLSVLPFEGDIHETACRLEHAFNDDLEVCVSLLLGDPKQDPSGKDIPPPSERVANRMNAQSNICLLNNLEMGSTGEVILIMTTAEVSDIIKHSGLAIGSQIYRDDDKFTIDGVELQVSEALSERIVLRCNV